MNYVAASLVFLFAINTANACEYAEPIACKNPSLGLHMHSLSQLKKQIKTYQSILDKNQPKKQKCTKANEIEYQIKFIEKYAKKNKNQSCKEHVKVLVLNSETLLDKSGEEQKSFKTKKAKLQLIDQAADVAEALVYYKEKHPIY